MAYMDVVNAHQRCPLKVMPFLLYGSTCFVYGKVNQKSLLNDFFTEKSCMQYLLCKQTNGNYKFSKQV